MAFLRAVSTRWLQQLPEQLFIMGKPYEKSCESLNISRKQRELKWSPLECGGAVAVAAFVFSLAWNFTLEKVSGSYGGKVCRVVYREVSNFRLVNGCKGLPGHSPYLAPGYEFIWFNPRWVDGAASVSVRVSLLALWLLGFPNIVALVLLTLGFCQVLY